MWLPASQEGLYFLNLCLNFTYTPLLFSGHVFVSVLYSRCTEFLMWTVCLAGSSSAMFGYDSLSRLRMWKIKSDVRQCCPLTDMVEVGRKGGSSLWLPTYLSVMPWHDYLMNLGDLGSCSLGLCSVFCLNLYQHISLRSRLGSEITC